MKLSRSARRPPWILTGSMALASLFVAASLRSESSCLRVAGNWPVGSVREARMVGERMVVVRGGLLEVWEPGEGRGGFRLRGWTRVEPSSWMLSAREGGAWFRHYADHRSWIRRYDISGAPTLAGEWSFAENWQLKAFDPDGRWVVSRPTSDRLDVLAFPTGELLSSIPTAQWASVSSAGMRIAISTSATKYDVWDLADPIHPRMLASLPESPILPSTGAIWARWPRNDATTIEFRTFARPDEPVGIWQAPAEIDRVFESEGEWGVITVENSRKSFRKVDLTDPTSPRETANFTDSENYNTSLFSTQERRIVYSGFRGLNLLDLRTPDLVRLAGILPVLPRSGTVRASGRAASRQSGKVLELVDLTDPDSPHPAGAFSTADWIDGAAFSSAERLVVATYAAAATGSSVDLYDIADLDRPRKIGSCPAGTISRLVASKRIAAGTSATGGDHIALFDLEIEGAPVAASRIPLAKPVDEIVLDGERLYATVGLRLLGWNVSVPSAPEPLGEAPLPNRGLLLLSEGRGVLQQAWATFRAVDLSDFDSPKWGEPFFPDPGYADVVGAGGNERLAVGQWNGEVEVRDLSDLDQPRRLDVVDGGPLPAGAPLRLGAEGGFLVASSTTGLTAVVPSACATSEQEFVPAPVADFNCIYVSPHSPPSPRECFDRSTGWAEWREWSLDDGRIRHSSSILPRNTPGRREVRLAVESRFAGDSMVEPWRRMPIPYSSREVGNILPISWWHWGGFQVIPWVSAASSRQGADAWSTELWINGAPSCFSCWGGESEIAFLPEGEDPWEEPVYNWGWFYPGETMDQLVDGVFGKPGERGAFFSKGDPPIGSRTSAPARSGGRFGATVPTYAFDRILSRDKQNVLTFLRGDFGDEATLVFVDVSGTHPGVRVEFRGADGSILETRRLVMEAAGRPLFFPLRTFRAGAAAAYATLTLEPASGEDAPLVVAGVWVEDAQSRDPFFNPAAVDSPSAFPHGNYRFPFVARWMAPGDSWWTEFELVGSSSADSDVEFLLETREGKSVANRRIGRNGFLRIRDVVSELFPGLSGDITGTLRIASNGVAATARICHRTRNGVFSDGLPSVEAMGVHPAGSASEFGWGSDLFPIADGLATRSLVGLASFASASTRAELQVRTMDRFPVGASIRQVVPGIELIDAPLRGLGMSRRIERGYLRASNPDGPFVVVPHLFPFVLSVDRKSGDPTFIPGRWESAISWYDPLSEIPASGAPGGAEICETDSPMSERRSEGFGIRGE